MTGLPRYLLMYLTGIVKTQCLWLQETSLQDIRKARFWLYMLPQEDVYKRQAEGEPSGRYFTDMTERKMDKLLKDVNTFDIMEMWVTDDVRPGRAEEKWLNMILRKK